MSTDKVSLDQALQAVEIIQRYLSELPPSNNPPELETETSVKSGSSLFAEVAREYKDLEFKPEKSRLLLRDTYYSEPYPIAIIENNTLFLAYSLEGEDANPNLPLYADMDVGTPHRYSRKLACISLESGLAGIKLRGHLDHFKYEKV
jgi:hypothetical protein